MSSNKAERFANLLRHADEALTIDEAHLCDLQNEVVGNPLAQAVCFRSEQNWLASGGKPSFSSVKYVPPPPEILDELMDGWMTAANSLPTKIEPLVAAAVLSFGFVYLHPFMDGNGRLSRFLIHRVLFSSNQFTKGQFLPVSVAMKKHEEQYLAALSEFSSLARKSWTVLYTGLEQEYECVFKGTDSIYRYWNATKQTEFLLEMAEEALTVHLQEEVAYLEKFDLLDRAINDKFDLPQNLKFQLINAFLENNKFSNNFRKKTRLQNS